MPEKQLSLRPVQGVAGWIFVSRTLTRKEGRDKCVGWDQEVKAQGLNLISMCQELIKGIQAKDCVFKRFMSCKDYRVGSIEDELPQVRHQRDLAPPPQVSCRVSLSCISSQVICLVAVPWAQSHHGVWTGSFSENGSCKEQTFTPVPYQVPCTG